MYDDPVAESIYQNGVTLVQIGIKDAELAEKGESRRYLTAIMNVYAGILLLLKSRLAHESAMDGNVLIYHFVEPELKDGKPHWVKKGRRTIDFAEIKERFALVPCPAANAKSFWESMDALQEFRNAAEHKFVEMNDSVVSAHMLRVHDVLKVVFKEVMSVAPAAGLGAEWIRLTMHTDVAKKIRDERDAAFKELVWLNPRLEELVCEYSCPKCGYPNIVLSHKGEDRHALNAVFKCGSCEEVFAYPDLIETILKEESFDVHGGRWKDNWMTQRHIGECPECGQYGFDADKDTCYCCGYKNEHYCDRCGTKLTIDEIEETGRECFRCRYVMESDD